MSPQLQAVYDRKQTPIIAQPKCSFCQREPYAGNYLEPPMCEQHYSITIMLSVLRIYDLELDYLTVLSDLFYPKLELTPYELLSAAQDMMPA